MSLRAIHRLLAMLIGLAIAVPAAAQTPIAECPADQAVYRLQTEDGSFEVGFIPATNFISAASDLYLYLTTTQRTYWFSFSVSNGYSGMTLHPVSDPRAAEAQASGPRELFQDYFKGDTTAISDTWLWSTLRFYSLDANLTFLFEPPLSGEPGPPYVMMPEIGLALWYEPQALSEDSKADKDSIPRGIFRLLECLPEPRAKVLP